MSVLMLSSAVLRIIPDYSPVSHIWSLTVLPAAAAILYVLIVLINGKEMFYKTAIPVWMMAIYTAFWTSYNVRGKMMVWLFWIAVFFMAFMYTELTSGIRYKAIWMLIPMVLIVLGTMAIYQRTEITAADIHALLPLLPDVLMLVGSLVLVFGIKIHPVDEYHPTWGDRSDGRKIRTLPPMNQVSPYIMVTRNTSTLYFEEAFEITEMERYIRKKRKEGLTNLGITHIFLACYCRAVAKYPGVNRFIGGQKIYTHGEDIQFCMTIKKEMTSTAPETEIKVHLSPRDTIYDVYNKVNEAIEKVKNTPLDSDFDNTAAALMMVPGVFLKFTVWMLNFLDYFGLLPKFLLEVSPFHGSVFFTSMGSLGIPPIYHHLYDFGNLPVFGSFGCKRRAMEVLEDGTAVPRKYIDFKFTMDERIVDGFYYAAFFKHYKRIFQHPEIMDLPPEEVLQDID